MAEAGIPWHDDYVQEGLDELLGLNEIAYNNHRFPKIIKVESTKDGYVSVKYPSDIKGKNKIVAPPNILVSYKYPLGDEFLFLHRSSSDEGFTLGELLKSISLTYKEIYKDKEEYGVWGHGISDLVFEEIYQRDGEAISDFPVYHLSIGS
jgi:hypothetical protein